MDALSGTIQILRKIDVQIFQSAPILRHQKSQQHFQSLAPNLKRASFGNITDPLNSIVATLLPDLQKILTQ